MHDILRRTAVPAVIGTALFLSGCVTWDDYSRTQATANQALSQAQVAQQSARAAQYAAQAAQQSADQARFASSGPRD